VDLPRTDDPDTAGFFEAARRGELAIRCCDQCGLANHPPRDVCAYCHSQATSWTVVAPEGELYSYIVTEQSPDPAFEAPYTVVLVSLTEHPEVRMFGNLPGRPELVIGEGMRATFTDVADGIPMPNWEPVSSH
jgi:uncharacterized protein